MCYRIHAQNEQLEAPDNLSCMSFCHCYYFCLVYTSHLILLDNCYISFQASLVAHQALPKHVYDGNICRVRCQLGSKGLEYRPVCA